MAHLFGRVLVIAAAVWAAGASLHIGLWHTFEHPVTMSRVLPNGVRAVTTLREQAWYEVPGLAGAVVLVVFSGLYLLAVRTAWAGSHRWLIYISVVASLLSIVSGFSVGAAYLPAAVGLVVGAVLLRLAAGS